MAYAVSNPKVIVDTKDLVLTVNGVVQKNAQGEPLLDEKEWLKYRRLGIGGSDTSTILGLSPWRSIKELWDDKVGNEPFIKKNFNAMSKDIGHMAEPYIRYQIVPFLLKQIGITNFKISEDTRMFKHGNPEYSFALADVDGLISIDGKLGILELKTTSFRNKDTLEEWKSGIVPPYYMSQIRHYMAVMNLDFAYICVVWGLNPLTEAILIKVGRNLALEEQLMNSEKEFWDKYVIPKVEPEDSFTNPATALSYMGRRFEWEKNSEPVDMNLVAPIITERLNIQSQLDALEIEKKNLQAQLDFCDVEIGGILNGKQYGNYFIDASHRIDVYCEPKKTRASYDIPKLMKDFPTIYEKGARFAATDLTNSEKSAIKECRIEGAPTGDLKITIKEVEIDPTTGKKVISK